MKLLLSALLLCLPWSVSASPYFRLNGEQGKQANVGAFIDVNTGEKSTGVTIPIVTHSSKDGYVLFEGEDWTPLMIGGGGNLSGGHFFAVGASANLVEPLKALIRKGLDKFSKLESYKNLRGLVAPVPAGEADISVSLGPCFVIEPAKDWKGSLKMFLGAAWRFN